MAAAGSNGRVNSTRPAGRSSITLALDLAFGPFSPRAQRTECGFRPLIKQVQAVKSQVITFFDVWARRILCSARRYGLRPPRVFLRSNKVRPEANSDEGAF